jgi:hypothetical protein
MAYDNTNSGALFINDKGDNEKRPDYRGTINIEGVIYKLAGWKRELRDETGKITGKMLSIKAEPKDEAPLAQQMRPPMTQATPVNRGATNHYIDPQDDIEF